MLLSLMPQVKNCKILICWTLHSLHCWLISLIASKNCSHQTTSSTFDLCMQCISNTYLGLNYKRLDVVFANSSVFAEMNGWSALPSSMHSWRLMMRAPALPRQSCYESGLLLVHGHVNWQAKRVQLQMTNRYICPSIQHTANDL